MIKNKKQYAVLRKQLEVLEKVIDKYVESQQDSTSLKDKLQYEVFKGQYSEILEEIKEYENLINARGTIIVDEIEDFSKALIMARIVSGLSQKDLADKLGIQQQQIQRYEMDDYYKTSLERIIQICEVLGIKARFDINKKEEDKNNKNKIEFLIPLEIQRSHLDNIIENMKQNCSLLN